MDQHAPLAADDTVSKWRLQRLRRFRLRTHQRLSRVHGGIPYLRKVPLSAISIIALLILINLVVWAICGLILTSHPKLLSTAALAYTLGLRHALDADHISAIDLMTRRLIATGQQPVTVGTFFSLGHSTIVVATSIAVAATAAGVSSRFGSFGKVGGIIGNSVSASFLILLGVMNAYILYKLIVQIRKIIRLYHPDQEAAEAWKIEGGGFLFRLLKKMFRLIDRPWKMYPLGVLFGLGFDTSSEIALLGISSIQGAKGTSMWLILVFPVLFTAGMCLIDTTDGALMMSLYVTPMAMGSDDKKDQLQDPGLSQNQHQSRNVNQDDDQHHQQQQQQQQQLDQQILTTTSEPFLVSEDLEGQMYSHATAPTAPAPETATATATASPTVHVKDPLTFLYYSIVLTTLTVICAIIIGVLQLLTLILNVASPTGKFWDGVEIAGDYYDVIGGSICGSFIVFGGLSVLCYKPWRRWVDTERSRLRLRHAGNQNHSESSSCARPHGDHGVAVVEMDEDDDDDDDSRCRGAGGGVGGGAVVGPSHGEAELIDMDIKGSTTSTVHRVPVKAFDGREPAAVYAGGSPSGGQT